MNTQIRTCSARGQAFAAAWLAAALLSGPAMALNRDWSSAVNGNFSDGTKWSGGAAPGSGDTARFYGYANGAAFKVTLDNPVTNTSMMLTYGAGATFDITLDLAGYDYTLTGTALGTLAVNWNGTGSSELLNVTNSAGTPSLFDVGTFDIGYLNGCTGVLNLNGSGVRMRQSATPSDAHVGALGQGTLNIRNGASLGRQSMLMLGWQAAAVGTVRVSRATLYFYGAGAGSLYPGVSGRGTLILENGATCGTSNSSPAYALYLATQASGTGEIQVVSGSAVTNAGAMIVGWLGRGKATLTGGSSLHTTSYLSLGNTASAYGSLLLSDTGTVARISGANRLGSSDGGRGELIVSNGAAMRVGDSTLLYANSSLTLANGRYDGVACISYANSSLGFMLGDRPHNSPYMALASYLTLTDPTTLKLAVLENATIPPGDTVTLLTSAGTLTGTFKDLPEGAEVAADGYRFKISYAGNAITLRRLLPRGTVVMIQ